MSVSLSYPGVYIQELPSSSHAIVPAPTSIAVFVGYSHPFQTQAFNVAQQCFSFNDYQTYFGPLFSSGLVDASLPRAVYNFFLNGGSTAWVVGLQPGLFANDDQIIARLGAANGGETISATLLTTSAATGGGTSTPATSFAVNANNPAPAVTAIAPASITAGDPAFTLTVTGTGFVAGSVVEWGGAALQTTYVSATTLTAAVPAFEVAAANAGIAVTVVNPAPGGGASTGTAPTFVVNAQNEVPTVTGVVPTAATVGEAFTLTVNGKNFVPSSVVEWGAVALPTTYVSDTQLTAAVPASDVAAAGTAAVTVTNPAPGGGTSATAAAADVTIGNTYPVATITSLAPASITAGNAAFTLTVNGTNFVPGSVVNFNNAALATTYVGAGQLTATVPASAIAGPVTGSVTANVTVTNPTPGGGPSAVAKFTINGVNQLPKVTSLSPSSAVAGGGTFTLTVTGSGFVPSSVVNWNGAPLATTDVSDTVLQAAVPAANIASVPAAAAQVTVTTSAGTGIVITAMELTDVIPMTVKVSNPRNLATFDLSVTYGFRSETYRGLNLTGTPTPAAVINGVSKLIQVSPAPSGYGTTIASQTLSLTLPIPANLVTCFSSADFIDGDGTNIAVFEPNSSLDNLEIFNLLMVPGVTDFSIVSAGLAFAERKRAFMIIDPPPQAPAFGSSAASPQPIQYWMAGLYGPSGPSLPLSQNGAFYFPYLVSNDPITTNNIPMAPSGFVAGVYAQTDATRGVWKAPAGLATVLLNTAGPALQGTMNDPQQGVLNLDSINCVRSFSGIGPVVWGARTLVAANVAYQQWMYVPVRRMTLFIEQTLLANLRWVVFEPNDEPLWVAIVSSISAFMLSLFRQGALQGTTPSDAFQVKCDSTTTTPADQAQGIVNIVVAFAPLKPAEFVVVQIAQLAGQTAGS
jgi:phage tail sheath protein FI